MMHLLFRDGAMTRFAALAFAAMVAASLPLAAQASSEQERAQYLERKEQQLMDVEKRLESEPKADEPAFADVKRAWEQVEHDWQRLETAAAEDWESAQQAFERTWDAFQEEWKQATGE